MARVLSLQTVNHFSQLHCCRSKRKHVAALGGQFDAHQINGVRQSEINLVLQNLDRLIETHRFKSSIRLQKVWKIATFNFYKLKDRTLYHKVIERRRKVNKTFAQKTSFSNFD